MQNSNTLTLFELNAMKPLLEFELVTPVFTQLFQVRMDAVKKKKTFLPSSPLHQMTLLAVVRQCRFTENTHERISSARLTREIGESLTFIEPVCGVMYKAQREKPKTQLGS